MNVTSVCQKLVRSFTLSIGQHLVVALERRLDRMPLGDLAEARRERDLLVGGEVLIGKEEHEVLEPRRPGSRRSCRRRAVRESRRRGPRRRSSASAV